MSKAEQSNEEENDLFYFESDHLALRGNKDYSELLKTMFILEAQRDKAIKDYNEVINIKTQCLNDPLNCVERLKTGTLGIPELQQIADIPIINWEKYNVKIPEQFIKEINTEKIESHKVDIKHDFREKNAWTIEEQRKLEELLLKYPPEEVESRRIKKIANELGTRTDKQVASRLQKYYLKLLKAGLPVPGPLPKHKSIDKNVRNSIKKHSKHHYYKFNTFKSSTFFPDLDIPVSMNEDEVPGPSSARPPEKTINKSNYLLCSNYHEEKPPEFFKTDIELQIELLKKIKEEKLIEDVEPNQRFQHFGYKCDFCEEEPIEGSRWHCTTCLSDSIDYCTDCMLSQHYSNNSHSLKHKFVIVRNDNTVLSFADSDSDSITGSSVRSGDENSDSENEIKSESEQSLTFGSSKEYKFEVSENCPNNIFESNDMYVNGLDVGAINNITYQNDNSVFDDS